MLSEGLWLKSRYLHVWIVGSVVAALYMPIVAGISCKEVQKVSFSLRCRCHRLIALIVPDVDVRGGKPW